MGYGDDATCFRYNENEVVKICTKEIKYFKGFSDKNANDFKKLVDQLQPHLLPVNKILYEDEYVFVYTQPCCQKFNTHVMGKKELVEIINIERCMYNQGVMMSTSAHNLGVYNNTVILFDYHDLRPITEIKIFQNKIIKHINRYI
jgi:hypothetical protein